MKVTINEIEYTIAVTDAQEITPWAVLQTALNAGGTVKLTQGINAGANDSYLVVSDDVTVTLDLNGQTIDRGLNNGTAQGFDNVITVYGKLTVQDTSTDQSGSITGGKNDGNGGGVRVESGTFTMEGGTIADNTAYRGSGVYVCSNSTFNMTGGTISDNEVRDSGGGVYVFGGAFTMSGSGGGVYVEANAFTMSGGTITGNTANRGGGVYVDDAATFAFSGAPVIDGNTWDGSAPDDVFLYRNSVITLSDALTCDPIGVTTQRKPGPEEGLVTITGGLREKGGDIGWFKSEDEGCALGWNDGGTEAVLGLKMAHSAAGHTGIYDGKAHGITVSVTAPGSGYTVRYGTTEGQYDLDESPIYTNAGDYTVYYRITAKGYFPVTGSAQVKITKATTTVVADAKTKVEGEADPALTYTVSGLVSGDALNGALSRAAGEAPGSYSITQGSLGSPNYALAFTGATLTITSKPPVAIKGDISFLPTAASVTKTSIGLSWTSFPGAEGYDIFFTPCGKKNAYQLIESVPADAQNSYTITGLKTGTPYKSYIMAWRMEGGAKTYIGKASPTVHAIAGMKNDAYCNAKSVAVRKKNLTVKVGKRKKITATVKGVKKGKKRLKVLKHVAKLRYYSSDCSIATVDSKGRVRGVGKGSCVIYVVANNGVHNEVNVTVK